MLKKLAIVSFVTALFTLSASAQLIVSEVDASGTDAADPVTGTPADVEFVEITNCGTGAVNVDGMLWYDDESGDFLDATPITGVASIAGDESVILISLSDVFGPAAGIQAFQAEFPNYTGQIGTFANGSGMSSDITKDDGATIFFQATVPAMGDAVAFQLIYPNAPGAGTTYQQSCAGLFDYLPPTPGVAVPEPSSMSLILMSILGLAGAARRRRK